MSNNKQSWARRNLNIPSGFTISMVIMTIVLIIIGYFVGNYMINEKYKLDPHEDVRLGQDMKYEILNDELVDDMGQFGYESESDDPVRFIDVKTSEELDKQEIENLLIYLYDDLIEKKNKETFRISVFVNETEQLYGLPLGEIHNFESDIPVYQAMGRNWKEKPTDEEYRLYQAVSEKAIELYDPENLEDMIDLEREAVKQVAKDEKEYSEDEVRKMSIKVTDFMGVPEARQASEQDVEEIEVETKDE